ncbi:MAG TPA: hypothetical protein VI653_01995 [Steroidobacteraceae bacterium]
MTDTSLQAQVDAQLLEQGAFAPLELLFNTGRLLYGDYESWRRRELELLDGALMGNIDKIRAELEQAVSYARRIGLVEQTQEFLPWHTEGASTDNAGSTRPLRISMDARLQKLIGSRYIRAQNLPQMDLFFDNPIVALTNGIVQSLATRNLPDAQRQLDQLYSQAPTHADLAAFDQLLAALSHLGHAIEDPRAELAFLSEVAPTARRLLAAQSRDLLSPLWIQLAGALANVAFNPEEPNLHRSFALAQAQDWAAVSDCIPRELNWQWHAPLCLRMVESAFHRRKRVEALAAWCHVCWRAPASASESVTRLRQPELSSLWNRFLDEEAPTGAGAEGLIDPLSEVDFPSWLLIQEPALILQLAEDLPPSDTAAEEHYRTVHRCLRARRARRQDQELAERKLLQKSNPALFELLKTSA